MNLPVIIDIHDIDAVIFIDCLAVEHDAVPVDRHCLDDTGIIAKGASKWMARHGREDIFELDAGFLLVEL